MKQTLFLLLLLCNAVTFAQDYPFLSAASRKIKPGEGTVYIADSTNLHTPYTPSKYYLDDGSEHNMAYRDSIYKSKESYKYATITYRDTLTNKFSYVLHKRSKEEQEANDNYWKERLDSDKQNREKLKGTTISGLTMTDMQGNSYTAEQLRGKVVIIDFWFTTCAPCIQEMPDLNKIKEDFGTDEVAYFAVTYDDKAKVEKFLGRVKYDYTIVPDSRHLTEKFGIQFYPTTLIIDKNGTVVYTGDLMGLKEKPKEMRKLLKKLTSGRRK